MIKLIIGAMIGFGIFYLYDGGDVSGLIDVAKAAINSGASTITEMTAD